MSVDEWGVESGFEDALGQWQDTPEEVRRAIHSAMGVVPEATARPDNPVRVIRPGEKAAIPLPADLTLEDGSVMRISDELPSTLPLGYHVLQGLEDGSRIEIIVCPPACYFPDELRVWGWAVQLYALRSTKSWGMGDLADLRRFARWSGEREAGILLLNPLHAATPLTPQTPSPYYPTTRIYRNLLYLCIEEIPGAQDSLPHLQELADAGRALNNGERIDRDAVFRLKFEALQNLWPRFKGDPRFEQFVLSEGESLTKFALFCSLAQRFGGDWTAWPYGYRHPLSLEVVRFAEENSDAIRFHKWIQWLLDVQMAGAGDTLPLMQDLPIGVDPRGADAWVWQDALALGATVGAPPDEFNTKGQNWGLPPFIPHGLRQTAYRPFRDTIRATLRHSGGLRVDHVMGLFRLFWIPQSMDPSSGGYVRYPARDLLAILSLESIRAGAFIVGEDLGTVERGVPEQLAEHRIMSYKVLWFETSPPSEYPQMALAAVSTHDLPTIAGLWSGSDLEAQRRLGMNPNEKGTREILGRLRKMTRTTRATAPGEVIVKTYRSLAGAPSAVVTASIEDGLAVEKRPNMPGTTDEWPNWSIPLPEKLEEIVENPLVNEIAFTLARRRRQRKKKVRRTRRTSTVQRPTSTVS
ncbi:MAG: 4-alpha-glucanotransferase [Desulfobacteraceae bacterium]|nr:MAG: 4-alpha-glucanotransferase [Desulfobacteraceae bacterium]